VKDLQDIPDNVKSRIEIVPVKWIDRVLEVALEAVPQPLADDEAVKDGKPQAAAAAVSEAITH